MFIKRLIRITYLYLITENEKRKSCRKRVIRNDSNFLRLLINITMRLNENILVKDHYFLIISST